jgi:hypothetical protein
MTNTEPLSEAVVYIAGGLERGNFTAAQITGAVLRELVIKARAMPADVSIGAVWAMTDDVIRHADEAATSGNIACRT